MGGGGAAVVRLKKTIRVGHSLFPHGWASCSSVLTRYAHLHIGAPFPSSADVSFVSCLPQGIRAAVARGDRPGVRQRETSCTQSRYMYFLSWFLVPLNSHRNPCQPSCRFLTLLPLSLSFSVSVRWEPCGSLLLQLRIVPMWLRESASP